MEKTIKIITTDGRVFIGVLKGLDQAMNMILAETEERVYSLKEVARQEPLGIYFVRGDSIIMMGEFEETEEDIEKLRETKCEPLINE